MGFALSSLQLQSPSITAGRIPDRHTKAGGNISPALKWINGPEGTQGYALLCHDPDAPVVADGAYGFVHWLLYNIPACNELSEATEVGVAGLNSFGEKSYGGPKPPPGHGPHHYFFILFALDAELNLPAGLSLQELLRKIEPHVLGMNRLVGQYETPEK